MQISLSNSETAAKKCTGLTIFQHYLSQHTDFLSHSLPLYFSYTQTALYYSPLNIVPLYIV